MKTVVVALAVAVVVGLVEMPCVAADLPRSAPEAQGVSSSELLKFIEAADRDIEQMDSFMLVRHGQVVAEGWWTPYSAGSPHSLFSLSKSFTSTAVGLAIAEGKLSLHDEVVKAFPAETPPDASKNLKLMRVSDLLRMSTGHGTEPRRGSDEPWTKTFLTQPVPNKPGTHFLYNTSATYMLSAMVQEATGQTVLDYLKPRLFEPLGIENPTWEASPQGISAGGYGLSVRTEDIAKFGQLYLQKGKWQGKQIVPEAWVAEATARQTSNGSNPESDWDQGYGYQFWRCRHGAYRGDGAFGQYCVVLPEQDAVIAITSGVGNMQAVLNLVWAKLLPALKSEPLSPDEASEKKLREKLAGLTVRLPEGSATATATATASASKAPEKRYAFPANPLKVESAAIEGGDTLVLKIEGKEHKVAFGSGSWKKGRFGIGPLAEQPVGAAGAWSGEDTLNVKIVFYETPFIFTTTLKFEGDTLRLDARSNVGFGATRMPTMVGKAE
jgi:CubicO group peptidase (beta-lactamase class C family)